jgi:hypothetical protein
MTYVILIFGVLYFVGKQIDESIEETENKQKENKQKEVKKIEN